ncbi:hypothetical protein HDV00_003289 [Rhizophlyctis rosea]|nr:hypothetical protein HDV00_003289 [Rhizophlyctis rosea]
MAVDVGDIKDLFRKDINDTLQSAGHTSDAAHAPQMQSSELIIIDDAEVAFRIGEQEVEGWSHATAIEQADYELARKLQEEEQTASELARRSQVEEDADYALARKLQEEENARAYTAALARKAKQSGGKGKGKGKGKGISTADGEEEIIYRTVMERDQKSEEDHEHMHAIVVKFDEGMKHLNLRVQKVEYVINATLFQRYEATRAKFAISNLPTNEEIVFHGTPVENIQPILKDGFKVGGKDGHRVVNGRAMGTGVYTGKTPHVPLGYAKGGMCMIVAKGLPGQPCTSGKCDKAGDHYEAPTGVIVFRTAEQLLPCYVVYFETIPGSTSIFDLQQQLPFSSLPTVSPYLASVYPGILRAGGTAAPMSLLPGQQPIGNAAGGAVPAASFTPVTVALLTGTANQAAGQQQMGHPSAAPYTIPTLRRSHAYGRYPGTLPTRASAQPSTTTGPGTSNPSPVSIGISPSLPMGMPSPTGLSVVSPLSRRPVPIPSSSLRGPSQGLLKLTPPAQLIPHQIPPTQTHSPVQPYQPLVSPAFTTAAQAAAQAFRNAAAIASVTGISPNPSLTPLQNPTVPAPPSRMATHIRRAQELRQQIEAARASQSQTVAPQLVVTDVRRAQMRNQIAAARQRRNAVLERLLEMRSRRAGGGVGQGVASSVGGEGGGGQGDVGR